MHNVYIGLGSNLDQPKKQLDSAIAHLNSQSGIHELQISRFYQSKPVGPQDQPDFVNAVAFFITELEPLALLDVLQNIENIHDRVRLQHWGPRTLDLDLLLYDNKSIQIPRLTVPHPFMLERGFVLKPLADLAPNLILNSKTITEHLNKIDISDLIPIPK
ncbi:2-amino-4-hydroxy-6-hydroxymethyldihydropteridine diphosphokinase [Marinomonas agarivorans]|nr:2-amino-4-hydroxy-6-hydroxymethyldihydropteridine diphosphokinase [Marinomonas agarivorans]